MFSERKKGRIIGILIIFSDTKQELAVGDLRKPIGLIFNLSFCKSRYLDLKRKKSGFVFYNKGLDSDGYFVIGLNLQR